MACTDNTGSYVNIKELPEINDVVAGDFLIIETTRGTNILDFSNFIIPIENTMFGDTILNNTSDIASLSTQYSTLSTDMQTQIDGLDASINYILTGANIETYAIFRIDAPLTSTTGSVTIMESSNVNSTVTYIPSISAFTFNFTRNFASNANSQFPPYGCLTDTLIGYNSGVYETSYMTTNSVTLAIRDTNNKATDVSYAMFKIIGGVLV